mmetsp:Transcript_115051/g.289441  ORF Transcript_115051/g.289441 Transcript_115051/m.289441 type:complete len:2055 (-) Transcript_115051:117-6281(-)
MAFEGLVSSSQLGDNANGVSTPAELRRTDTDSAKTCFAKGCVSSSPSRLPGAIAHNEEGAGGEGDGIAAELGPQTYMVERARLDELKRRAVADEDYDLAKRLSGEMTRLDAVRVAVLEKQKSQAVANEDYDLAKRLKSEIEALGVGRPAESEADKRRKAQIAALEEKKVLAVTDEDFELAKRLKVEIEGLRRAPTTPEGDIANLGAAPLLALAASASVKRETLLSDVVEGRKHSEAEAAMSLPAPQAEVEGNTAFEPEVSAEVGTPSLAPQVEDGEGAGLTSAKRQVSAEVATSGPSPQTEVAKMTCSRVVEFEGSGSADIAMPSSAPHAEVVESSEFRSAGSEGSAEVAAPSTAPQAEVTEITGSKVDEFEGSTEVETPSLAQPAKVTENTCSTTSEQNSSSEADAKSTPALLAEVAEKAMAAPEDSTEAAVSTPAPQPQVAESVVSTVVELECLAEAAAIPTQNGHGGPLAEEREAGGADVGTEVCAEASSEVPTADAATTEEAAGTATPIALPEEEVAAEIKVGMEEIDRQVKGPNSQGTCEEGSTATVSEHEGETDSGGLEDKVLSSDLKHEEDFDDTSSMPHAVAPMPTAATPVAAETAEGGGVSEDIAVPKEEELPRRFDLDGRWVSESTGEEMARIQGSIVAWFDGPSVELQWLSDRAFLCTLFEAEYRAELDSQRRLVWSDGDIWTRAGDAAAEASASFNPPTRGEAIASDEVVENPEVTTVLENATDAEATATTASAVASAKGTLTVEEKNSGKVVASEADAAEPKVVTAQEDQVTATSARSQSAATMVQSPCRSEAPSGDAESDSDSVEDVPSITPAAPAATPPVRSAASRFVVGRSQAQQPGLASAAAASAAAETLPRRPAAMRPGTSEAAAAAAAASVAAAKAAPEASSGLGENIYSLSQPRDAKVAMRVGKKVKITGSGPFQGRLGTVLGFDEDGDPELRLDDGDTKVFYRHDVSVVNEVRRRPLESQPQPRPSAAQPPIRSSASATPALAEPAETPPEAAGQPQAWRAPEVPAAACAAPVRQSVPSSAVAAARAAAAAGRKQASSGSAQAKAAVAATVPAKAPTPAVAPASAAAVPPPPSQRKVATGPQEEDPSSILVKVSLADDLRIAKLKLAKVKGMGQPEAIAALHVAEHFVALGRHVDAATFAKDALAIFQEIGEMKGSLGQARVARLLAKVHLAQEEPCEAYDVCKDQLAHSTKLSNSAAEAKARLALVDVNIELGRPKQAIREATASLEAAKDAQDRRGMVAAQQALASASLKISGTGGIKKAKQALDDALTSVRESGDVQDEALVLLEMCKVLVSKQEQEEAYNMAENAASLARRVGCKRTEAAAQREVASILVHVEMGMAVQAAEDAIRLCNEIGDVLGEIASRHVAASVYLASDRLLDAQETAETALTLARELGDRREIKACMQDVMQLRVVEGQTERALEAAQEELELAKEDGTDLRRELAAMQRVVSMQLTLDDGEAALKSAEAAVELEAGDDKKVEGWAFQLLAEVHLAAKRYTETLSALSKAIAMMQEQNDPQAIAGMLHLMFDIHAERGNESEALRARQSLRVVYQEAGWKDQEADTLMMLAEIILQVRGPREAAKLAKDAVAICKDIDDKAGEAAGMLVLAQCQVASKASTDALRSTVTARRLFQSLFDAAGESQALLTAADVYTRNGASDEAVRVAKEAQKICQKAGETKAEADALETIANLRLFVLQKEEESGRQPKHDMVKDAIEATKELDAFLEKLGDAEDRRGMAMVQLSSLQLMAQEPEEALKTAEQNLELSVKLDRPVPMGQALLSMSQAHQALGSSKEALQAAEDAVSLFEQLGEHDLVKAARQAVDNAKKPPPAMRSKTAGAAQQGESSKKAKPNEMVNRDMHSLHQSNGSTSSAWPQQSQQQPASGPRRGFSSAAGVEVERRRPRVQLRPPSPEYKEPNQERRRQQLLAAMEARAAPRIPEPESPTQTQLRFVLQKVRPDWNNSELVLVQEKFSAIQIDTAPELFRQLNQLGVRGFNQKLKDCGKRPLKKETLEALREFGDQSASEALRDVDPRR